MDPNLYGKTIGEELKMSVRDVGMSVPMGISAANVAGIYAKIRMGAGSIEIGFPGKFMGQRGAHTPGMYGEDQRQAIRELAKINEVNITTHASYNIMGLMGRDERGNFSVQNATQEVKEIQRAIDFAADVTGGGSVVVHTGEWVRPLTDMVIDDETGQRNLGWTPGYGRNLFRRRISEVVDANFIILDDRDSRVFENVTKDKDVAYPEWLRAKKSGWGIDQDGNRVWIRGPEYDEKGNLIYPGDYIDYEGRKIKDENIYDPVKGRVPVYDPETGRFKTRMIHFRDFEKEAREYNEWLKRNYKRLYGMEWYEDPQWYYKKVYPEEMYIRATLETNEGHARGWALQYAERVKDHMEIINRLKKAREFYEKLDKSLSEEEKWKILKTDTRFQRLTEGILPPETKDPLKMIDELMEEHRKSLEFARQASTAQEQQAEETHETKEHLVTPIKRFQKVTTELYAMAAIHAIRRTKDPSNPIVLTIENLFPEYFGSHPEELKWIVEKIRERVVEYLTEEKVPHGATFGKPKTKEEDAYGVNPYRIPGLTKEEARKLAEKHVKVTLDTGHLNIWRRYWVEDPNKTLEENDQEFKKWYLEQVEKLAKAGMIGNVHLTDNFGYQDDHLAPGQGTAPIKEVLEILRKYGYDKAITVEPGADASTDLSDFHGLMKAWRFLGTPVYGIGSRPAFPQTWTDIHYSYFGQPQPPYFVFGTYAPSPDWTLWSAVPLE